MTIAINHNLTPVKHITVAGQAFATGFSAALIREDISHRFEALPGGLYDFAVSVDDHSRADRLRATVEGKVEVEQP
jgi:hypothetical protein